MNLFQFSQHVSKNVIVFEICQYCDVMVLAWSTGIMPSSHAHIMGFKPIMSVPIDGYGCAQIVSIRLP